MKTFIGIDLGTSSMKLLLVDQRGKILNNQRIEYEVSSPLKGWSEQNPSSWWQALDKAIPLLLQNQKAKDVYAIGIAGQMHGLVVLDEEDNVVRPCILWNDGRTQKQTDYLNHVVGKDVLSQHTANVAFAGFTAPKILWLYENEKENFDKINKIMLPKDYLVYKLCGNHTTDFSDASGTLLLDVKNKRWDEKMCKICHVNPNWLPKLCASFEVVGTLCKSFASKWGMDEQVKIVAGAGDNAAAAIGTNAVRDGKCNVSLGTSGTVFVASDNFSVDKNNALHSFCHATDKFHLMGCILSAASCNSWWMDVLKSNDFDGEQKNLQQLLGKNDCFFLPYLTGERSPHNDVDAKGAFIGLNASTTRQKMTLAVLEGVSFALKDNLDVARQSGLKIETATLCGGGAKSKLWQTIIANVCDLTIHLPDLEEGPSYGGAILAMVGSGIYPSVQQACDRLVTIKEEIKPERQLVEAYQQKHQTFKKLYQSLKELFKTM
ncbi:MAG: xylulokinase [Clostridia bacterium]|nr:xylulokinase [Clostridia bacterium]